MAVRQGEEAFLCRAEWRTPLGDSMCRGPRTGRSRHVRPVLCTLGLWAMYLLRIALSWGAAGGLALTGTLEMSGCAYVG